MAWCHKSTCTVYNPNDIEDLETLPVIFGYVVRKGRGYCNVAAMSEDGVTLYEHSCSDESWAAIDLGVAKFTALDVHENVYKKHYPDGYHMEWVSEFEVEKHERFQAALDANSEMEK